MQLGAAAGERLPDACTFGTLGTKSRSTYEMAPAEAKEYGQADSIKAQSSAAAAHNRQSKSGSVILGSAPQHLGSVSSIRSVSPLRKGGPKTQGQKQDFVLLSTRMEPSVRQEQILKRQQKLQKQAYKTQ